MTQPVPVAAAEAPLALRLVTFGVPLLLLGTAFLPDPDGAKLKWLMLPLALGLLTLFLLAPRRLAYTLTPQGLSITRLAGRDVLPYVGLRARRTRGGLGLRAFGTGLPGYLTGHFTLGPGDPTRVRAAASRAQDGVVESGGVPYFLTPADPGAFLRSLRERGAEVTP